MHSQDWREKNTFVFDFKQREQNVYLLLVNRREALSFCQQITYFQKGPSRKPVSTGTVCRTPDNYRMLIPFLYTYMKISFNIILCLQTSKIYVLFSFKNQQTHTCKHVNFILSLFVTIFSVSYSKSTNINEWLHRRRVRRPLQNSCYWSNVVNTSIIKTS